MRSKKLLIAAAAAATLLAGNTLMLSAQTVKQSDEAASAANTANVLAEIMGAPRIHRQRPTPLGDESKPAVQPFMKALPKYAPQ